MNQYNQQHIELTEYLCNQDTLFILSVIHTWREQIVLLGTKTWSRADIHTSFAIIYPQTMQQIGGYLCGGAVPVPRGHTAMIPVYHGIGGYHYAVLPI